MKTITLPDILVKIAQLPDNRFEIEGSTVHELLQNLCNRYSQITQHLFHENGMFKNHFLLAINGSVANIDDPVTQNSSVDIVLATSGGRI